VEKEELIRKLKEQMEIARKNPINMWLILEIQDALDDLRGGRQYRKGS